MATSPLYRAPIYHVITILTRDSSCHERFQFITEMNVYFNWPLVFKKGEYWRLLTTFLYLKTNALDFYLYMSFFVRFMSTLEESSPPPQTKNFLRMVLTIAGCLILAAQVFYMPFIANYFSYTMLYLWAWRHPQYRVSILGLVDVKAPFLPWMLLLLRWASSGRWPATDCACAFIGHVYYFLTDFRQT
ncbi:Der1-like family protein [Schizosaccharomyces japonicus yFS275]|uniref:Derlin n=1 Tax=Schizosaccharomyces japonicus (strain yFS275 / FY16936) TaxID=402676 RepID=B6JWA7_SCHJY|nr:Der1-like family protein [Schizosaccharomyces japonicus yFS275]EEB05658.1 Der1-like family protein [Schizosaccharomyces japonicus yFS275]